MQYEYCTHSCTKSQPFICLTRKKLINVETIILCGLLWPYMGPRVKMNDALESWNDFSNNNFLIWRTCLLQNVHQHNYVTGFPSLQSVFEFFFSLQYRNMCRHREIRSRILSSENKKNQRTKPIVNISRSHWKKNELQKIFFVEINCICANSFKPRR